MPDFEKHCWAEVDLDALLHNFAYVQRAAGKPVCAVVKADAYGHGDAAAARLWEKAGAAAFAVSCLAEALRLRRQGIARPVLVLGRVDPAFAAVLAEQDITAAVYSAEYAAALSAAAAAAGVRVPCHLKVDTGMGRIGFGAVRDLDAAVRDLAACYALPGLEITGIFQHFAVADSNAPADIAYTQAQLDLFKKTVAALRAAGHDTGTVHCANSAAALRCPGALEGMDMVRAGIVLYGLDPSDDAHFPALRPAMTLKAVIEQVKDLAPGQSVSYGRTYVNAGPAPRRVATVTVGYADGCPRRLSGSPESGTGGVMLVRGKPAPVLGRVCMDQTILDVTGIDGAAMGDEVTVFGPAGAACGADTADTVAAKTGTINYEVVCGVARRVPRAYIQNGKVIQIVNYLEQDRSIEV